MNLTNNEKIEFLNSRIEFFLQALDSEEEDLQALVESNSPKIQLVEEAIGKRRHQIDVLNAAKEALTAI